MSDQQPSRQPSGASRESAAERRRRLDRIFGKVLPEQTRDDADEPGDPGQESSDEWLRRQVPPHHG